MLKDVEDWFTIAGMVWAPLAFMVGWIIRIAHRARKRERELVKCKRDVRRIRIRQRRLRHEVNEIRAARERRASIAAEHNFGVIRDDRPRDPNSAPHG